MHKINLKKIKVQILLFLFSLFLLYSLLYSLTKVKETKLIEIRQTQINFLDLASMLSALKLIEAMSII